MKSKALFAVVSALVFSFASAAFPQSAKEIAAKFEKEKAEALDAYLAANPAAADRDSALGMLIESRKLLGQEDAVQALLESRYQGMSKGADADLNVLIGEVVAPLIESYKTGGKKDKARTFIEQARADLASHPVSPQLAQFFDGMLGELNQPGVGDELEIAFTALGGAEIDLAKMKGKVVLVDFWATWCGPCVGEMPTVIAAYDKFKDKGFEVVGISLDQDKAALEGFIKEQGMTWPQYFDGKGWQNDIAGKYGIQSIPATFLVGKDGKIVATDLRGPALENKLAELLAEAG